jgi:hypothetical protein
MFMENSQSVRFQKNNFWRYLSVDARLCRAVVLNGTDQATQTAKGIQMRLVV